MAGRLNIFQQASSLFQVGHEGGIEETIKHPGIWRGGETQTEQPAMPTGYPELDAALPARGWPSHSLTEILLGQSGVGELRLLMPALAAMTHDEHMPVAWIVWIAPPYIPYAPALAGWGIKLSHVLLVHPKTQEEGIWAMEQALRSGNCAAVLAWLEHVDERHQRRLQLAAEEGACWGVLFRSLRYREHTSTAALRLCVLPHKNSLLIEIIKCRGGHPGRLAVIEHSLLGGKWRPGLSRADVFR